MPLKPITRTYSLSFAFSGIERALQESFGRWQFGLADQQAVLAHFGNDPPACVYCGSMDVRRWDHLVAVMVGGETVVGNLVPACQPCDDSKQHRPYAEWMRHPKRVREDTEARIARLVAYVSHFGYEVVALEKRVDADTLDTIESIRRRLKDLRREAEEALANAKFIWSVPEPAPRDEKPR